MGLALVGLYALLLLVASHHTVLNGAKDSFFVNNRSSSASGIAFSIIVSCVGASATIGVIGMACKVGTPAFWWLGAGAVGLTLLSLLLAARVRASRAYTLPEMIERHLGAQARPVISGIIVLAWMAILAAQFAAINKVLAPLTGLNELYCLGIGFVLITLHTLGGQAAIMRVDRWQAFILLSALVIVLVWLSLKNNSWAATVSFEVVNKDFPVSRLVYFLFIVGANYLVCPMLFGRMLSAKDTASAQKGGLLAVIGLALCSVLIVCVGLACRGITPEDTAQDAVFTYMLFNILPPWLYFFISIALLSAIVSSADSCLVTAATVLSNDLLKNDSTRCSRICVLLLAVSGAALTLMGKDILGYLLMAYDIFGCGVVVPVFIGLLLEDKRKILPAYAILAVTLGGALGAASAVTENTTFSYAGLAISALVTLAGTRREAEQLTGSMAQKA